MIPKLCAMNVPRVKSGKIQLMFEENLTINSKKKEEVMSEATVCNKCGEPVDTNVKHCRKCEGKQFVSAAKNLGGFLVNDVKGIFGKLKKVRIKIDQ